MDKALQTEPSGGLAAFQARKRQGTRANILAAASGVFATTPYVRATIDDLIRAAKISRATFYLHFDSKLALALAIYDGIEPESRALFDRLATLDPASLPALKGWLRDYAGHYLGNAYVTPLLAQLELFEPAFRDRLRSDRDTYIERLGSLGVRAFAATLGNDDAALAQRTRARLLFQRMTFICAEIARPNLVPPRDAEAYLDAVALDMRAFLKAG
jgi:AcrR family transcriptional regulator